MRSCDSPAATSRSNTVGISGCSSVTGSSCIGGPTARGGLARHAGPCPSGRTPYLFGVNRRPTGQRLAGTGTSATAPVWPTRARSGYIDA
jgi:hypothetical protein